MIDAASTAIAERAALDRGLSRGALLSVVAHLAVFGDENQIALAG